MIKFWNLLFTLAILLSFGCKDDDDSIQGDTIKFNINNTQFSAVKFNAFSSSEVLNCWDSRVFIGESTQGETIEIYHSKKEVGQNQTIREDQIIFTDVNSNIFSNKVFYSWEGHSMLSGTYDNVSNNFFSATFDVVLYNESDSIQLSDGVINLDYNDRGYESKIGVVVGSETFNGIEQIILYFDDHIRIQAGQYSQGLSDISFNLNLERNLTPGSYSFSDDAAKIGLVIRMDGTNYTIDQGSLELLVNNKFDRELDGAFTAEVTIDNEVIPITGNFEIRNF